MNNFVRIVGLGTSGAKVVNDVCKLCEQKSLMNVDFHTIDVGADQLDFENCCCPSFKAMTNNKLMIIVCGLGGLYPYNNLLQLSRSAKAAGWRVGLIMSSPFVFEGSERKQHAELLKKTICDAVDARDFYTVLDCNQVLKGELSKECFNTIYLQVDSLMKNCVLSLLWLSNEDGVISVDYDEFCKGIGSNACLEYKGVNLSNAISLEKINIPKTKIYMVVVSHNCDYTIQEFCDALEGIQHAVEKNTPKEELCFMCSAMQLPGTWSPYAHVWYVNAP